MDKPAYLKIVDGSITSTEHDEEFVPLPFYPWDERPPTLPLEHDETATAIHLSTGNLAQAAAMLRVPIFKVARAIKKSPRLAKILDEATSLAVARAAGEVIDALSSPDNKRREWGAARILSSKAAAQHPLSPAPAGAQASTSASLTLNQANRSMTFRWRTDADTPPPYDDDDARTIEG